MLELVEGANAGQIKIQMGDQKSDTHIGWISADMLDPA